MLLFLSHPTANKQLMMALPFMDNDKMELKSKVYRGSLGAKLKYGGLKSSCMKSYLKTQSFM